MSRPPRVGGSLVGRVFLGRPGHWAVLLLFAGMLWAMGARRMHVRDFGSFSMLLLALVTAALLALVRHYRPGDPITREPFDDAQLPHAAREPDEV